MTSVLRMLSIALFFVLASCASVHQPDPAARAALVPSGNLRFAFISPASLYSAKDPATGELKGLAPDLAKDLGQQLGVPSSLVTYGSPPTMVAAGKEGQWDIVIMGVSPERAAVIDFTAPVIVAESGFLVRKDLAIASMADVDRSGIRIGVFSKSSADNELSKSIKNATLVRVPSISELYTLLATGKADVLAAAKSGLFNEAAKNPGSRVLQGSFLDEPIALGVPKGRDPAALAFIGRYIESAKSDGRLQAAIERAGLRGVVVPR